MKLLGVDYGTKRIGLATGDTSVSLAFPLKSVDVGDNDAVIQAVVDAAKEEDAERIVVGMPYRVTGEGETGDIEERVNEFVRSLGSATDLSVDTEDERFTTVIADRLRRESGRKGRDYDRDAKAAAVMLETYMQRLREE